MATLFLTSTGLSASVVHQAFVQEIKNINRTGKVLIITTASNQGPSNPNIQSGYQKLVDLGFSDVHFFDLLSDDISTLKQAKIIYVCGGNTFRLLKAMRDTGADQIIQNFYHQSDGIYIGVSAGSLVVGQSIASAVGHDENKVHLADLTGLRLINDILFVHYDDSQANEILELEQNFPKVRTLTNTQALIINGNNEQLI
jgi:dipeptidase E